MEHVWRPRPGEGPHGEYCEQCEVCGVFDAEVDADCECAGPPVGILSGLKDRIERQIAAEYHDEDRQREVFENLTVARLLEMLEYMGDDS